MSRIRAGNYEQGKLAHPRVSATSAVLFRPLADLQFARHHWPPFLSRNRATDETPMKHGHTSRYWKSVFVPCSIRGYVLVAAIGHAGFSVISSLFRHSRRTEAQS